MHIRIKQWAKKSKAHILDVGERFVQDSQGTFREHSGNNQGTIKEHSGNIQGTFSRTLFTTPKICTGVCMRKRRFLIFFGEHD